MAIISSTKYEVDFEPEDFLDLVDTAGYGIAYWCHRAVVEEDQYTVFYYNDNDKEVSSVIKPYQLELAWAALLNGDIQVGDWIKGYLRSGDLGDIDSECADVIVQAAIFGEIVYG